nr:hypothetical protein [Tanacetum cinerariifolium]
MASRIQLSGRSTALTMENATLKARVTGEQNSGSKSLAKPKVTTTGLGSDTTKDIPPQRRLNRVAPTPYPAKKQRQPTIPISHSTRRVDQKWNLTNQNRVASDWRTYRTCFNSQPSPGCPTRNERLSSGNRDSYVVVTSVKKVWKATGKVFARVGFHCQPTGRMFTLDDMYPLNRITSSKKQLTPEHIFWSNDLMKLKSEALKEWTKVSRPLKAFTVSEQLPNASGSQPKSHVKPNRISLAKATCLQSAMATPSIRHISSVERKVKQVWKPKQVRQVWKPTGKVLTTIGYQWRPTGRIFNLGNQCPLTKFTPPKVVSATQHKKRANTMADMTAPTGQAPKMAPLVRTNDQILPRIRWVQTGYLKFSVKGTKREVSGMPIPSSLITTDL